MHDLYSETDLQAIRGQLKKRLFVLLAVSAIFLAAVIYTLILDNHKDHRPEALTTAVTLLWGFTLIFGWDVFCRPLRCYAKHLNAALHGRTHTVSVEFSRASEDTSVVDGVTYRDLVFLGDADKHGDRDRMFYWDVQLAEPPFRTGEQVTLCYYDKFITGYSRENDL